MGSLDKIPAGSQKQYSFDGYFDMYKLYDEIRGFIEDERHYDWTEKNYIEKNTDGVKRMDSYAEADLEYTDYYMLILSLKISMRGKGTEVKVNGKTKILAKGNVSIIINPYVLPDFQEKRTRSALMEFGSKLYDKYFANDEITKCSMILMKDIKAIRTIMQKHVVNI